jgi:hypothetical protein
MWKRVLWDIFCLILVIIAPWWVALIAVVAGIAVFPWYLEAVMVGMLYDVLYGGVSGSWIFHMIHTVIFTVPLLIAEFIKPKLNL